MNGQWNEGRRNAGWTLAFLVGLLFGGLAGTAATLLLAPRTGKQTRSKIQKQGAKLRHQAADSMEEVVTEAGDLAHEFTENVNQGVDQLQQQVQDTLGTSKKK